MGNPGIIWPIGEALTPPAPGRVLWKVYRLSERGEKLREDAALRTGQVGVLIFWSAPGCNELNVSLQHLSGAPNIDAMHQVRLLPKKSSAHGLKVGGAVVSVKGGRTDEFPQVWWCVVDSVGRG